MHEPREVVPLERAFLDVPDVSEDVHWLLRRFVNEDGVVLGWGLCRNGELGTGTRNNVITPFIIGGLDKPIRIGCSSMTSVWLGVRGAVLTMGGGMWGELGVPDPQVMPLLSCTEHGVPISTAQIDLRQFNWNEMIVDVKGGHAFFAALSSKGEVWGANDYAQCTPEVRGACCATPRKRRVAAERIVEVACGNYTVLALSERGEVYGWGYTLLLGEEESTWKTLPPNHLKRVIVDGEERGTVVQPVKIRSLSSKSISHIRMGPWHAFAFSSEGRAYSWGLGEGGRLGHGDEENVSLPKEVKGLKSAVVEVACGSFHTCLVTSSGLAYACGDNQGGQCGVPGEVIVTTFRQLDLPLRHKVISASCGRHHTLLLLETGEVVAYGTGLGVGVGLGHGLRMIRGVPIMDNYISLWLTSGSCHNFSLSLPKNLSMLILGLPHRGVHSAISVIGVKEGLLTAALGQGFSIILNRRGVCYAMGMGGWGQLGIDLSKVRDFTHDRVPVVRHATKITSLSSSAIVQVSAGICFSAALSDTQRVFTWGSNVYGQCGLGVSPIENPRIAEPQEIGWLADKMIVQVACGCFFALALSATGCVYSWGNIECCGVGDLPLPPEIPDNLVMESLGNDSTASILMPVEVPSLSNIVAVAAGAWHAMALNAAGEIYAWGIGACGRLGYGGEDDRITPVKVLLSAFATKIGCGPFGSYAITDEGKLYVWGANGRAQLSATGSRILLPTHVLDDVMEATLGKYFALVLTRSREFRFSGVMEHQKGVYVSESFNDLRNIPPELSRDNLSMEGCQGVRVFAGVEHAIVLVEKDPLPPAVVTELHYTLRDRPAQIIRRSAR
ncbi:regulator of chromosome condensation, putative [Trypanosoma brucei gambiense DAL972]|uniref:Regulator of chromosome condensation, putative n=1 Tax=Trypanosoma brucei gambiense (strain MHOM/CI/86/DAL972) TaxID=679716 RepID=C9ZS09_TRYB9|nr:LOW QUALITY PROTEIN: regulator of chromosome condensation, putative [Trypanosoma brucei gambiense DAL972]CBH12145.1 regulator of chromosome condensation, putative [Trypanosoma brucei gambiense DAL972]|eukprot:XP_011774428.1 LOW QUALITY PROTEIN: regulator of chromosome condensation, putative [Trypanosoma brucei gambiense DAL972]